MKLLVLGASGLLGNTVYNFLSSKAELDVYGSLRNPELAKCFPAEFRDGLVVRSDLLNSVELNGLFEDIQPDVVINCVSLPRERLRDSSFNRYLSIYSLFPHRLATFCQKFGSRLILISSDGVFSGSGGAYDESHFPDAHDIYGISKFLGEVNGENILVLRTSMLGHELNTKSGLLEWFLSQEGCCKCFPNAIFSGLPTIELAKLLYSIILPRCELSGMYHIASRPISKFDLLSLVAEIYNKKIDLVPDPSIVIDRSLDAQKFVSETGYVAPDWPEMIRAMYSNFRDRGY